MLKNLLIVAALAACGTQNDSSNDQPKKATSQEVSSQAKNPPKFLVVRVPVDASGEENIQAAEAKEVASFDGKSEITSAEEAHKAFASSEQGVKIAEELDKTSSTESWGHYWYWNTPWYPGKVLGRGYWWGRNPYLNYGGYSYSYSYGASYNYYAPSSGCGGYTTYTVTCCTCNYNYHYYRY